MAASATAVSSYFSTTISPRLCSNRLADAVLLRVPTPRVPRMHAVTHLMEQPYHTPIVYRKRGFTRISVAVSQEEAAASAMAVQDEVGEIGEQNAGDEGEGQDGGEPEAEAEAEEQAEVSLPQPPQNTKLYFGNLPYNCDSSQLAGIIQEYASPEMVEVLYDRATGRSRGFAFVTMSTVEDCELVIQNLDGSQYNGRTLRVNFSDRPRQKDPLYKETEFKLFIGNLSWSATSEHLEQAFKKCGNVVSARVLYDGDTGKSRGYGFVCYSTKDEMDDALESLDGEELEGRPMRVCLAQGKKN